MMKYFFIVLVSLIEIAPAIAQTETPAYWVVQELCTTIEVKQNGRTLHEGDTLTNLDNLKPRGEPHCLRVYAYNINGDQIGGSKYPFKEENNNKVVVKAKNGSRSADTIYSDNVPDGYDTIVFRPVQDWMKEDTCRIRWMMGGQTDSATLYYTKDGIVLPSNVFGSVEGEVSFDIFMFGQNGIMMPIYKNESFYLYKGRIFYTKQN